MSEVSFASLEPTLLARKGGAKPAMRPQLAPIPETVDDEQLEDLGWNDMGDEAQSSDSSEATDNAVSRGNVVALGRTKPSAIDGRTAANEDEFGADAGASPILQRRSRDEDRNDLAGAAMPLPTDRDDAQELIQRKPAPRAKSKQTRGTRRAAFTLRLDTERHLKLRLAATMRSTSAQALVTDALDAVFAQIEDLDVLVARIKPS